MALIVTLGILTVITFAVFAFVVTMRTEHLAARNVVNRTQARQYVDIGIAHSMAIVDYVLVGSRSCYPVQGWYATNAIQGGQTFQTSDCLGTPSTNHMAIPLFQGSLTNLLPGFLAQQAAQVQSGWIYITETNGQTAASEGVQVGRVALLIVNLSGMPDVHGLTANQRQHLGDALTATAAAPIDATTGAYHRVYLTQSDLHAANGGPVSNLVTFSYDPNPDVFFTTTNRLPQLGTRDFANVLTNRFNINDTNRSDYIASVTALLTGAGVLNNPEHVAYSILNYSDPGRIPIVADADKPHPYRTDYGIKDVPLINEVALTPINANPEYGVSVELWYPFVPRSSPVKTTLRVGVFTNESEATAAITTSGSFSGSSMCFEATVPVMYYGDSTEFFVDSSTNHLSQGVSPISFKEGTTSIIYRPIGPDHPVWILPRVYVQDSKGNEVCVDEALVAGTAPTRWESTGDVQFGDPRTNCSAPALIDSISSFVANTPTLNTTNANCTVHSLPMVLTGEPLRSAGELRHIYAPGLTNDCLDLAFPVGAACRDRFTVRDTNTPVRGLIQANTPYTNVWKASLCDVLVGWTNAIFQTTQCKLQAGTSNELDLVAEKTAYAAWSGIPNSTNFVGSWNRFEEMLPMVASNLASVITVSNLVYDVRGDILAGIADRVSFRQNAFLVVVCGQRLSPHGRVLADQRAAAVILRDAFTGRWVVQQMYWLTQ